MTPPGDGCACSPAFRVACAGGGKTSGIQIAISGKAWHLWALFWVILGLIWLNFLSVEHTLLQAIARTNRVARGKKRGYIVDYIGLANHLTEALTIYAVTDEMQELLSVFLEV